MLIIASLILIGVLLMLIELLLIPGVGIAGVLSLASLVASCWYAFHTHGPRAGIVTTIVVVAIIIVMLVFMLRAKTWKRFELDTEVDSKVNAEPDALKVGDRGIAQTRLAPMGTGKFEATSCEVKSHDNTMIAALTPIEVVEIADNKVIVKPVTE